METVLGKRVYKLQPCAKFGGVAANFAQACTHRHTDKHVTNDHSLECQCKWVLHCIMYIHHVPPYYETV